MPTITDVRVFDQTDDEVRGPVTDVTGAFSILCHVRRANTTALWNALLGHHASDNTPNLALEIKPDGKLSVNINNGSIGADGSVNTDITNSTTDYLAGVSKATGTTFPRFHLLDLSTGVWEHEVGSQSFGNPSTQAGGTWRFGEWNDDDDLGGRSGIAGIWAANLSDADFEACEVKTSDWVNNTVAPLHVWQLGETPVKDYVGSADSTTITGTTISSAGITNFVLDGDGSAEAWPPPGEEDAPERLRLVQSNLRLA